MGLDSVEIVVNLEDTFDIRIPDEDAEKAVTIGDIAGICCAILVANDKSWPKQSGHVDRELVLEHVRRTVSKTLGAPLDELKAETRLRDLNLD